MGDRRAPRNRPGTALTREPVICQFRLDGAPCFVVDLGVAHADCLKIHNQSKEDRNAHQVSSPE